MPRFIFTTAKIPIAVCSLALIGASLAHGAGKGTATPTQEVTGASEVVAVPMVSERWAGQPHPPSTSQGNKALWIGHLPGFKEAKERANLARKLMAGPPSLLSPTLQGATELAAQTTGTEIVFDGPNEFDTGFIFPPDPILAAGPNNVVVAVNTLLAIYDKSGNKSASFQSFSDFFASLGISGLVSDPKVIYDQTDNRFIVSIDEIDFASFQNAHVFVAISQTSDPTGMWFKYALNFKGRNSANSADTFPDFPDLGLSPSAVYITTNQFVLNLNCLQSDNCPFSDSWISVIGLPGLLAGSSTLNVTTFKNVRTASGALAFSIAPALSYGAPPSEFLVAANPTFPTSAALNIFSITTTGTPTLSTKNLTVPSFSIPPDAAQPFSSNLIATNDFRILNVVWNNNLLWFGHNVAGPQNTAVARWYELDAASVSGISLSQSGDISGAGEAYFPAISVLADGDTGIVFSTSSETVFPSAGFTGRGSSDAAGTTRTFAIYKQGTSSYGEPRWGDYNGVSLDPSGGSLWMIAEYSFGYYGTSITEVASFPELQVSPASLDFGQQSVFQQTAPLTVTVTNPGSNPTTFLQAGFTLSNFVIASDMCSGVALSAGTSCTIAVSAFLNNTGPFASSMTIPFATSGAPPGVLTVPLKAFGIAGVPSLSPSSLTFPSTSLRTNSPPQTVTVTNTGNGPLGVNNVIPFGDFFQNNSCIPSGTASGVLSPGAKCTINVTYHPTVAGSPTTQMNLFFSLTLNGNASVSLSGTGVVAPLVAVCPTQVTFANQAVSTSSAPLPIIVSNTGTSSLTISNLSTSGDFSQSNTCAGSVAPGTDCIVNVTFTPTASGARTGTLTITDNAAGSPQTVSLAGGGLASTALLRPTTTSGVSHPSGGGGPFFPAQTTVATANPKVAPVDLGKLPFTFEANQGQFDQRVRFASHDRGYALFLTADEAVISLNRHGSQSSRPSLPRQAELAKGTPNQISSPSVVRLRLVEPNPAAELNGIDEVEAKTNYFRGNDPKRWHVGVPRYAGVRYEHIYPGVELVFHGSRRPAGKGGTAEDQGQDRLEYDFIIAPRADPKMIRLGVTNEAPAIGGEANGAGKHGRASQTALPRIDSHGNLIVSTPAGEIVLHKPVAYQPGEASNEAQVGPELAPAVTAAKSVRSERRLVEARYTLSGDGQVGFELGPYDNNRTLVIDPVLTASTFLGGSGIDQAAGVALDAAGNIYVVGQTLSSDFPSTVVPIGNTAVSSREVFVAKFNPSGTALIYSAVFGGTNYDFPTSIGLDTSGNVVVAGTTRSLDFPVVKALQSKLSGASDAFVTKLSADGSALLFSTYLGGAGGEQANGLSLDSSGNIYVAGSTSSGDFPVVNPFQTLNNGQSDAFLTKLSADGSTILYSTYFGGSGDEGATVALDAAGNIYLAGGTTSSDLPTTAGAFQPGFAGGGGDGFIAKLDPTGSKLLYATYLGGMNQDSVAALGVDNADNLVLTGFTNSADFPLANPLAANSGNQAGSFLAKLHAQGCGLIYSTFLNGVSTSVLAQDGSQNVYLTGAAGPGVNITPVNAIQSSAGGSSTNAFIEEVNAASTAVLFSTYFGGSGGLDVGSGIAVDSSGNIYVVGTTSSSDFPTLNAFQPALKGELDAFLAKISPLAGTAVSLTTSSLAFPNQTVGVPSAPLTFLLRNYGSSVLTVNSIVVSGDFSETDNCIGTVPGGGNCTVSVTFKPTIAGTRTGSLTISDAASGSPRIVGLSGTAFDSPYAVVSPAPPASISFGNVNVGSISAPQTITLSNIGDRTLNIASIGSNPPLNLVSHCGATLAAGTQCQIDATFQPTFPGLVNSAISIYDDSPNNPQFVQATGTGIGPAVSLSSGFLYFGQVVVGNSSSPQPVIVTNSGNAPLTVTSVAITPQYTETDNCVSSSPIAPAANCTINVTFAPSASGNQNGAVTVNYNAPQSPQSVSLQGVGLADFSLTVDSSSITISAGQKATFNLNVNPIAGFNNYVSFSVTGAPQESFPSFTPSSVAPDGTNPAKVQLNVTTTRPSQVVLGPRGLDLFPVNSFRILVFEVCLAIVLALIVRHRRLRTVRYLLLAAVLLGLLAFWTACGGGGGPMGGGTPHDPGTPVGTYTLTVTGTSFNSTHSINLTLVVTH